MSLFSLSIECPNLLDILNFPRQFVTVSLLYFSILQFPHFLFLLFFSGQEEIRYPNGTLQISFADGSVKRIDTDGTENINFPDGTKVVVNANGERTLLLPSGQKEIHTTAYKVRKNKDIDRNFLKRCKTRQLRKRHHF